LEYGGFGFEGGDVRWLGLVGGEVSRLLCLESVWFEALV
jgi:hypothetical protein